jgi:hypothetical protein
MLFVFTYSCFQQKCNIIWCSCHLTVTRRMPLVEQEHLMLPDHMSSPSPWWGSCFYFCFLCSIRQQLFVYLFFFFCHRITDAGYTFGMLPHKDTLSWFRANQSLLSILNAAFEDRTHIYHIYHTRGEHTNHYATDVVIITIIIIMII